MPWLKLIFCCITLFLLLDWVIQKGEFASWAMPGGKQLALGVRCLTALTCTLTESVVRESELSDVKEGRDPVFARLQHATPGSIGQPMGRPDAVVG